MSAGSRGPQPGSHPYSLDEVDGTILGQAGRIRHTVADVVLLLLYADPRPIRGRARQAAQALLAIREVLPEGHVEPIEFELGRTGPYSARLEATIDQLVFARYAEVTGGPRGDLRLGITPKGRAYAAGRFDALPAGVGERLARKRREWDTLAPAGVARYARVHGLRPGGANFKGGRRGGGSGGRR